MLSDATESILKCPGIAAVFVVVWHDFDVLEAQKLS
jgi:hypothetical protein